MIHYNILKFSPAIRHTLATFTNQFRSASRGRRNARNITRSFGVKRNYRRNSNDLPCNFSCIVEKFSHLAQGLAARVGVAGGMPLIMHSPTPLSLLSKRTLEKVASPTLCPLCARSSHFVTLRARLAEHRLMAAGKTKNSTLLDAAVTGTP